MMVEEEEEEAQDHLEGAVDDLQCSA